MLCHKCHKREATVHLTQIIGDKVTTLDFCPECGESRVPPEKLFRETCHYCGGPFACTTPILGQPSPGGPDHWALCQRCAEELYRYASVLFSDLVSKIQNSQLSPQQAARYQTQSADLDRHMQAWVSQRDAK